MERVLISIEPLQQGWMVRGGQHGELSTDSGQEALEHASRLARARYMSTGLPTAVKVRMQCGDMVLMAMHG